MVVRLGGKIINSESIEFFISYLSVSIVWVFTITLRNYYDDAGEETTTNQQNKLRSIFH